MEPELLTHRAGSVSSLLSDEEAGSVPPLPERTSDAGAMREVAEWPGSVCFPPVPRCPHLLKHPIRSAAWFLRNGVGILALIGLWAVIAAIPIVQILALGYLLEVQGRIARSGRFRDAFPMLELAPRLGSIALGIGIWLLPLMFISGYASDAQLIDPGGPQAKIWQTAKSIAIVLITGHLCLALARGGSFFCFFRPLKNLLFFLRQLGSSRQDYWRAAERNVREFILRWRIGHLFSLGLRGLIGAFLWLVLPTFLFAAADKPEGGVVIVTLIGGVLLMLVLSWLPFLQARFAAENRFGAFFELSAIRQSFNKAPLAFLFAVLGVPVLALPLYLSKVALPPRDALVLLTPLFIISIYPAKVISGWAYHRAMTKPERARFWWRWPARWLMVPVLGAYVFLLFFTQFIGAQGKWVLFQHHAFLLPVPF